jgi:hypothetical protein
MRVGVTNAIEGEATGGVDGTDGELVDRLLGDGSAVSCRGDIVVERISRWTARGDGGMAECATGRGVATWGVESCIDVDSLDSGRFPIDCSTDCGGAAAENRGDDVGGGDWGIALDIRGETGG